jgi:hypothetical protein
LNNKRHVAEGEADVLVHENPVMVYKVEPVPFLKAKLTILHRLAQILEILDVKALQTAVLRGNSDQSLIRNDLEITPLVPNDLVVFLNLEKVILHIIFQAPRQCD